MKRASTILRAALCVVSLSAAACGSGEGAGPHLEKAAQFADAGKLENAQIELRRALQAEPKNAEVNFQLGKLLHRQEQIPDAVFFYEEALRLNPKHSDAALTLAFLMLGDDIGYAERLVNKVIAHDPKNALAWVRRSDIALARSDVDAALAAALTAAEIAPKSARAQIQAGLVQRARIRKHELLGEAVPEALYQDALATFERAKQAEDNSPSHEIAVMAWVEHANTLDTWPARKAEATKAYREAIEVAVKLGGSEDRALDAALAHARRTADAEFLRWVFERSVAVHPDRLDLGRRLARAADPAGADHSPTLARLIAERPDDAAAQAAYARDLATRGRAVDAIAQLEAASAHVKEPAVTRLAQVEIALAAGDESAARRASERLAKDHAGSFEELIARATLLRHTRDFGGAANAIARAIDAYGASAQLQMRLAELRLFQGDATEALKAAENGLSLPTSPMQKLALLRIQSRAQLSRGAYEAAADSFGRMTEITKGRVATADLVPYAAVLYAVRREKAARSMLDAALEVPSPSSEAVILFAQREGPQDPQRAEQLITKALETMPQHPGLLEEAARFDLAAGRAQQAKARLQKAIAAVPGFAPLLVTLARVQLQTGDPTGALQSAEEALRLDPENPNSMGARVLVAAYTQLGKTGEAVKRLQAAQAGGKLGLGGQALLAQMLAGSGDRAGAIRVLEAILKKAPELAGPKNNLAYFLVVEGKDLDRALSLAQEARAAIPNDGGVADTLGYAYLAKKLPDAALAQFDEAVQLSEAKSPEWGLAQLHRAQTLHELGRLEAAAQAAKAALEAKEFPEQTQAKQLLDPLAKPS